MKKRSIRRIIALTLATLLSFGAFMLTGCGKSYEYTFGDVEWRSTYKEKASDTEEKFIKDTYYYSDDWFADKPASENPELALASMQLVASCVTDDPNGPGAAFLKSMGFEEVGFNDFNSSDPDDCNYTWARKKVGDTTLVAVVILSVNVPWELRNKVWKQNFTVNSPDGSETSGEHYAYAKAVDKIIDDIAALGGDGDTTFWITGQSRGGGIANILAARLPEKADKAKIFAYTFEAPATVDADAAEGDYKYIHNYICSDDLVTYFPMWGMTRYGQTHDLKTEETDEGIDEQLTALGSGAAGMKARIVTDDVVTRIAANLEARVPSRADYSAERTDSWTDEDGSHEVTYSYQEALVKIMDLVFSEEANGTMFEGLAAKKGDLEDAIGYLTDAVKLENAGSDPSAKYWAATKDMYAVLQEVSGEELSVSTEDLYKVLRFAGPVLIEIPEGGGEPDTELLTDVIGYTKEIKYSHHFDTIIARLKVLAPTPEK